jgi:hypothetical protein
MAEKQQPTSDAEGRRRLIDEDRQRDTGERRREYEVGEWQDSDDPLGHARRQAIEVNSSPGVDRPGMNAPEEARQLDERVTGSGRMGERPRKRRRPDSQNRTQG